MNRIQSFESLTTTNSTRKLCSPSLMKKQLTFRQIYPNIIEQEERKYVKLTYFGSVSQKIAEIFAKNYFTTAFPPPKTTAKFFNAKDETNIFKNSEVYKLS